MKMTTEKPKRGDMVRVAYEDGDEKDDVFGEVTFRIGVEGDFGICVDPVEVAGPVFARTYASNVYSFNGDTRTNFGELQSIEIIEE